MRVLFISDADAYYGAPKAMLEMIISLREQYNIDPVVFTSQKSIINEMCDDKGIENHVTFHRGFLFDEGKVTPKYVIKNCLRFVRYKIDNILGVYLAERYIDFNTIDIIHSNSDRNDIGMILAKKHNIKHVLHIRECVRFHSFRRNYIEYLNKNAGVCFAISKCVQNEWMKLGIESKNIRLVYDGIDLDDIVPKAEYNSGELRIVCVGSLNFAQKSPDRIIKSMEYLSEELKKSVYLDFIGEGEDEKALKDLAKKCSFKNIRFLGYRKDVRALLSSYDIGIMSSSKEAFGRTTIEYGAAGLAVLATRGGANTELIDDGKTGLFYDYDDFSDLANKICVLYYDRALIEKLGKAARIKAIDSFSKELNAQNVYKFYKEQLG